MKKNFIYALMSAIALTGATVFSSCSSSEDTAEVNPNFNPEKNEVLADFVFNIASNNVSKTRMTAANTQADLSQLFRGIENAQLFAFKRGTDGSHVFTTTADASPTAEKAFSLGAILSQGQIDPDGTGETAPPKSRRVIELSLPIGTNTLMFWGKAPKSGEDADNAQGNITFNANTVDISSHSFSLKPRVASASTSATTLSHYQEIVTKLLNAIVNSSYTANAGECVWSKGTEGGDGSSNATAISVYWSDVVDVNATSGALTKGTSTDNITTSSGDPAIVVTKKSLAECPLGEILANAFISLNTVYSDEVRAGSGESIHHLIGDLNQIINKVADAKATSYTEWVVKQLGIKIQENIRKVVDANGTLRNISTLKTNAEVSYTDVTENLDLFPDQIATIGLPKGALQLQVVINKTAGAHPVATWSYVANSGPTSFNYSINKYTYPAELCYFGNSPVRVTDDTHITTDYPDGTANWVDDSKWNTNITKGWDKNDHVKSSTRSVAMQHNINYGTALLKSYVTFKSGVTKLSDNNKAIQAAKGIDEENKQFDVSGSLFTLKGILIGGQPQTVGWNYLPSSAFDHVIYDKSIVNAAVPTPTVSDTDTRLQYNYTLVWDNYDSSKGADNQGNVFVALEFVNNTGSDFWGEKNLIRAGATFYLIGKLMPTGTSKNTSSTITWPTDYALPPYNNTDGSTIEAPRVFIQDYVTTANFSLDGTSLQHAYNTVPDLRSSQISLGLSVDLDWRPGLTFNSTLGQ